MKETKKHYSKEYPPLRLFKDDILEIISIFQRNFKDFELSVDKYDLSNISEIDNIKLEKTNKFSIRHHHSYDEIPYRSELIDLELTKNKASLYLSNDSDFYLLGIATKIDNLLSTKVTLKQKIFTFKTSTIVPSVLILLSFIFFITLPWKFADHSATSITLMIITFIPALISVIWFWIYYVTVKRWTIVYLTEKDKRPSFFKRNQDQIIMAFTVGIITAIITGIVTTIINNAINHK